MAKKDKYSILNLKGQFPDDGACLEHIFATTHSYECSCGGRYSRVKRRLQFQCSKCRHQIAPMVNTIFEKSCTPLTMWFHAIFIFSNAKSGVSAKELERQLGVTYKTAWRMLKLIRESLQQKTYKLRGNVEMDEGYFGGKGNGGKNNEKLGEAMATKSVVIAAVERDGEIRAKKVPNATARTIGEFLEDNVDLKNTRLLTDKSNRYENVAAEYHRETVHHAKHEFVRGDVHVNNVESFWSQVKRSIRRTHKSVSKQHFSSYLDGFVWHRNNRHNDNQRFLVLLGALVPARG